MALTWPVEQKGSTGENVRTVQYLVTAHGHATGVDGVFGPLTKTAVEAFQSSRGLGVDGIVGPQTWPQLIIQVQQGSNGDAVRAVQSQIHGRGDGAHIVIDGIFGPDTNDAVRAFQTLLGLSVDGIVGQQTWIHLVNGYLAAPDPQTAARDVFSAWEVHNRDQAAKNATPGGCERDLRRELLVGRRLVVRGLPRRPRTHVLQLEALQRPRAEDRRHKRCGGPVLRRRPGSVHLIPYTSLREAVLSLLANNTV